METPGEEEKDEARSVEYRSILVWPCTDYMEKKGRKEVFWSLFKAHFHTKAQQVKQNDSFDHFNDMWLQHPDK